MTTLNLLLKIKRLLVYIQKNLDAMNVIVDTTQIITIEQLEKLYEFSLKNNIALIRILRYSSKEYIYPLTEYYYNLSCKYKTFHITLRDCIIELDGVVPDDFYISDIYLDILTQLSHICKDVSDIITMTSYEIKVYSK